MIEYFLNNNETTRQVIAIWLDKHYKDTDDRRTANNFPEIKLSLKFQYLEETRYGKDKAVYNLRNANGETFSRVHDVEKSWRGAVAVPSLSKAMLFAAPRSRGNQEMGKS